MRRHLKQPTEAPAAESRLLEAAREVFARHGYEGATVRLIAEAAGTSPGAINYHWQGKDGLWQAVCEESFRELAELMKQTADFSLPPEQLIPVMVPRLFDALLENQQTIRIIVWATLEADAFDYGQVRGALQPLIAFGKDYWKAHAPPGVSAMDLELAVMQLRAILIFTLVDAPGHRHAFGKDLRDPDYKKRVSQALVRAFQALLGLPVSNTQNN